MRNHIVLPLVLAYGATISGMVVAAEPIAFSGSLQPGWNLVAVPFGGAEVPDLWIEEELDVWSVPLQNTPAVRLAFTDGATAQQHWLHPGGYWVYTSTQQTFEVRGRPGAPTLSPTPKSGWQVLPASSLTGLTTVVLWDPKTSTYGPITARDLQNAEAGFAFREPEDEESGHAPLGLPDGVTRALGPPSESLTQPGQFEPPASFEISGGAGLLARADLSETSEHVLAHVAYVVRGKENNGTDHIRYWRSEQAGKSGSFSEAHGWRLPSPDGKVRDMALTAQGDRVSIAWIVYGGASTAGGEEDRTSKVVVVQSHDGGKSFERETVVQANEDWKRGLDIAYDASSNHHLVWVEANKAYYLKNLEGTPSNVFDNELQIPPREEDEEPQVVDDAAPTAATAHSQTYRFERIVGQPSLHVGNDRVSIVVRQTRAWDPRPVANPTWTGTEMSSRDDDQSVKRDARDIRNADGWGKVWKTAYEVGDEALWDTVANAFQYRYSGTWQDADQILLAQRVLNPGPRSEQSPGHDSNNEIAYDSPWTVSSIASVGAAAGDNKPSYPKLARAPWGLVLVYEDGVSDNPNQSGHNAIRLQSSVDGGQTWSTPVTVGAGYVPAVAASEADDIQVLYYQPTSNQEGTIVSRTRSDRQSPWGEPVSINADEAKPIHWRSHGEKSDGLEGGVSLAAQASLFFAAWIERTEGYDRLVTSRASRASEAVRYSVQLPGRLTQGQRTQIEVTAVNAYGMRVSADDTLWVKTVDSSSLPSAGPALPSSTGLEGLHGNRRRGDQQSQNDVDQSEPEFSAPLSGGHVSLWADPTNLQITGAAGTVQLLPTSLNDGLMLLEGASGSARPQFAASADGNYEKAKWLRDQLWRNSPPSLGGKPTGYQVEYEPAEGGRNTEIQTPGSVNDQGKSEDASFLAKHERVWAYTQGIALAQYARTGTLEANTRAQALARTLCAQAVRSFDSERQIPVIRGWPFSWNTRGDHWKDARLVTGATAWVVHGIGLFLVSEAFESLSSDEQKAQRTCYREALAGLEAHRRDVITEDGRRFNLMTAGWTTQGLKHARNPWKLRKLSGAPMAREGEVWDYYDVLDAIGYDEFNPENLVTITRSDQDPITGEKRVLPNKMLTEAEIRLLKKTVKAENVVTEHNLDVLSVLNHALNYASDLGLDDVEHLTKWRDEVRNGIFHILWDRNDIQWRAELEAARIANASNRDKQNQIDDALSRGEWGRVVTGGGLRPRPEENPASFDFIPNHKHTAIDNCSWLSLSVDYQDLTSQEDIDALARCLEFTALSFNKDIAFEGKTYYGSHYFFDGFEDQYIEATDRQEKSFHLEATAGLIMGLLAFAEHHPEHPRSDFFGQEALALWAGVQDFVIDHEFPYSSQRIIDLSTLLNSSTAIIWFIDTYDQFNRHPKAPSTEADLEHTPTVVVPPFGGAFLLGGQSLSAQHGATPGVQLSVLKWFLQVAGPQLAKEPAKELVKASIVRSASQNLVTQGGKSAGQIMLSEVILTGLGGAILGTEASNALLDFVNNNYPVSVHNIYLWNSSFPLQIPADFRPLDADAFADPQAVQKMSLAEKALLAELALSPVDWSAPETWGHDSTHKKPLLDLALFAGMPADIIVHENNEGVQIYYGPRVSGVGGYVVEVSQDRMKVLDRHSEEASEVSADLSPVELAALLRLPELIRAWILRAPEPNQRGLLEEYLHQWIFTAGANPLPRVRSASGDVPIVSGTSKSPEGTDDESSTAGTAINPDARQETTEDEVAWLTRPEADSFSNAAMSTHAERVASPVKPGIYIGLDDSGAHGLLVGSQFRSYARYWGQLAGIDASKLHILWEPSVDRMDAYIEERRKYNHDRTGKPVYLVNQSFGYSSEIDPSDFSDDLKDALLNTGGTPEGWLWFMREKAKNRIHSANEVGISVVAAAGNHGTSVPDDSIPAGLTADNLTTVAALSSFSASLKAPLSIKSDFGPKTDIAAPGAGLASIDSSEEGADIVGYTSDASPVALALKGLIILEFTEHGHDLTPIELKQIVVGTRRPSPAVAHVTGIINPAKALAVARKARILMDNGAATASEALSQLDFSEIPPLRPDFGLRIDAAKATKLVEKADGSHIQAVSLNLDKLRTTDWSQYIDVIFIHNDHVVYVLPGEEMAGHFGIEQTGLWRWKETTVWFFKTENTDNNPKE